MHPSAAREVIGAAAESAINGLAGASLPQIELPATLAVTFRNPDLAEMATWLTGVVRTAATTVSISDDDPIRLYRTFVNTVLLTRDIAE